MLRMWHLRELLKRVPNRPCKQWRQYTEGFTPSTFSKIDVSEHAPVIDSYLTHGFIIRGSLVQGSVALLPRAMFNWKVHEGNDLQET